MRVITFNLNGIRSAVSKGFLPWLAAQDADFICVQELKAQAADLTAPMRTPDGYHGYFIMRRRRATAASASTAGICRSR